MIKGGEIEEGELSGDDFYDGHGTAFGVENATIGPNRGQRRPIQVTIHNQEASKLPVSFKCQYIISNRA